MFPVSSPKIKTSLSYFAKVDSSFWANNPGSEIRLPLAQKLIPTLSSQQAAQAIVDGVAEGKSYITRPYRVNILLFFNWLCPPLARFIMRKTSYPHKKTLATFITRV